MNGVKTNLAGVGLRFARPEDESFLLDVFASTRTEELALTSWTPQQKDAFLRMQFDAQRRSYANDHPHAEYWVIQHDYVDVGRMITDRNDSEIALMDIALLPQHRQQGIGSVLLRRLTEEATRGGKSIRLHVERFNPALLWYERLGFKVTGEGQIHLEMIWRPRSGEPLPGSGGLKEVNLKEVRFENRGLEDDGSTIDQNFV
jgi:ribosomal protein S18 acetylase RimI-like enzyme